jgi:hypothetical protein
MTRQEMTAWKHETARSDTAWRMDAIHNGQGGTDMLLYKGGVAGVYVAVARDGEATSGRYDYAMPHIGEAEFNPQHARTFGSFDEAVARVLGSLGLAALLTITNLDAATCCARMQS